MLTHTHTHAHAHTHTYTQSFLLSHVCDELHEPASLSTLPQVCAYVGSAWVCVFVFEKASERAKENEIDI